MKHKIGKKIISLLMVLVMMVGVSSNLFGCGAKETGTNKGEENVILTNAEWITGLANAFGLTEYQSSDPVFEDVTSDSEIFAYVQSCAEWDVFENVGGKFNPEEPVTREFAVKTAVATAEVLTATEDKSVHEQSIEYALNSGLIERNLKSYLDESIYYEEGQKILDWALAQYQNREFVEYENVEFQEEVLDLTDKEGLITLNGDTAVVSSELGLSLEVGDVFIAPPTVEDPAGIAKKIVAIETKEDGSLHIITEMPELGDIYAELDFAQTVVPQIENIIVYDGATLVAVDDKNTSEYVTNVNYNTLEGTVPASELGARQVAKAPDFSINVNFTKGTVGVSKEWESSFGKFKADLEEQDNPNIDKKALKQWVEDSNVLYEAKEDGKRTIKETTEKFTGGYEITGSLKISDISADVEVKTNKVLGIPVGIEKLTVDTNYKVSSSLKLKGELKEEIKVATFPIPVGATGATVNIEVVIYATANGQIEVKVETSTGTTLTYKDGNVKKTSSTSSDAAKIELGIDVEVGAGVTAKLKIVAIPITDVGIKAGVKYSFSTSLEDKITEEENEKEKITTVSSIWTNTIKCTYPIVKLSLGAEPDSLIKLNLSWEMVGPKGLIKAKELELYNDQKELFVIITVEPKEVIESTEETESSEMTSESEMNNLEDDNSSEDAETGILGEADNINISTYSLSLVVGESGKIDVISIPEGYKESDLKWNSEDNSVATVSGGDVVAVGEGATTIVVSTSDGKYKMYCTVIVSTDKEIEFVPL